jgi:hypothetical protein
MSARTGRRPIDKSKGFPFAGQYCLTAISCRRINLEAYRVEGDKVVDTGNVLMLRAIPP